MSLASTLAAFLYAALPRQVRCPAPRPSAGRRDFDAFMVELSRVQPLSAAPRADASIAVTRLPPDAPQHAVRRRARH